MTESDWYRIPCSECGAKAGQLCKDTSGAEYIHGCRYNTWWKDHLMRALRGDKAEPSTGQRGAACGGYPGFACDEWPDCMHEPTGGDTT